MTTTAPPRRILLLGRGRMGQLIESLGPEYGFTVAGYVDIDNADRDDWPEADVAIDFSVPDAVPINFPKLAARRLDIVLGTTGWAAHEAALRASADRHGIGVVAAPNFALGVNLFNAIVARAAEVLAPHGELGAWLHELHHAAKVDAPSGTALALLQTMRDAGYTAPVDVSSTRAGAIPGTHTIGFDGGGETITLTHTARDRSIFARGALEAARWVDGRRGWFTMRDVVGG
ncbi:MAG: dihydrodipicolinate reductase C-terminal domain-containing protein [Vicinamibacterales bacterium]